MQIVSEKHAESYLITVLEKDKGDNRSDNYCGLSLYAQPEII